jgi:stress response protein SCP2
MLNDMADGNGNQAATKADIESLKADIETLGAATKMDSDSLRTEAIGRIESAKMETFERIERSETTLLTEFRK